jgi:uncharacterized iron-regulated membrane protein
LQVNDSADNMLYRTVWRWHFYAGLLVAPLLLMLAVTGAIYLFNDEINDAVYPELRFAPERTATLPPGRLIDNALASVPGGVATRIDMPAETNRTAQVFVTPAQGEPLRVFVDPGNGRVLGSYVYTSTLVGFADVMHGSLMIGTTGDRINELAACWTLVLLATGVFLWWPRRADKIAGVVAPRLRAKGRIFWRDLHAVTGIYTAAFIAFLVLTGLPWAGLWGDGLNRFAAALDIGYPAAYRMHGAPAGAPTLKSTVGEVPWTLGNAPLPLSRDTQPAADGDPHAGHAGHQAAAVAVAPGTKTLAVDDIAALLAARGLTGDYRLSLPQGAAGVYTAYTYPNRPQGQRTLHFDRYSGQLLAEVDYADYGWLAKAVELGVALHMGNYFGIANQVVMLLACVGIVTLVISGTVMWWRRRPAGRLGAPAATSKLSLRGATLITVVLGAIFPLVGLSLLVVFCLEYIVLRHRPRLQRILG